jgi:hypothetical protein
MSQSEIELHFSPTRRSAEPARADLTKAVLTGADLRGVDLRYVRGLTRRQLRAARIDARTRLPLGLRLVRAIERIVRQLGIRR